MAGICYTISVYCTVDIDSGTGEPEVSGKEICRQIEKALKGHYRSPIDAVFDLELMETEMVPEK